MDWEEILAYIIESICGIVISIGIPMLISYLKEKANNEYINKLIDRAGEVISNCVIMTNQTYVDGLKAKGSFGKTEQKIAFETCKNNIIAMLNDEAKVAIIDTFGNLEDWINICIEASVNEYKSA